MNVLFKNAVSNILREYVDSSELNVYEKQSNRGWRPRDSNRGGADRCGSVHSWNREYEFLLHLNPRGW